MGSLSDNRILIPLISCLAIFVLLVGISVIIYPLLVKKKYGNIRKRDDKFRRFSGEHLLSIREKVKFTEMKQLIQEPCQNGNDLINCTIEYRTRGSQLIVGILNVSPSVICNEFPGRSGNSKFYFLLYLNGDLINSPCESTKKPIEKTDNLINQIFIFTVMPYDIPNLELIIQAVLIVENKRYIVGNLKLPLYELDQHLSLMQKTYSLSFPNDKTLLPDCLLCLSVTNCKNLLKIKIVRLYILDESIQDCKVTGLGLRFILECSGSTQQVFDSSKKKYKGSLMFHETLLFDITDLEKKDIGLTIQLLESSFVNGIEVVNVQGVLDMNSETENHCYNQSWTDILDNQEMEIVQWYPISYERLK